MFENISKVSVAYLVDSPCFISLFYDSIMHANDLKNYWAIYLVLILFWFYDWWIQFDLAQQTASEFLTVHYSLIFILTNVHQWLPDKSTVLLVLNVIFNTVKSLLVLACDVRNVSSLVFEEAYWSQSKYHILYICKGLLLIEFWQYTC